MTSPLRGTGNPSTRDAILGPDPLAVKTVAAWPCDYRSERAGAHKHPPSFVLFSFFKSFIVSDGWAGFRQKYGRRGGAIVSIFGEISAPGLMFTVAIGR